MRVSLAHKKLTESVCIPFQSTPAGHPGIASSAFCDFRSQNAGNKVLCLGAAATTGPLERQHVRRLSQRLLHVLECQAIELPYVNPQALKAGTHQNALELTAAFAPAEQAGAPCRVRMHRRERTARAAAAARFLTQPTQARKFLVGQGLVVRHASLLRQDTSVRRRMHLFGGRLAVTRVAQTRMPHKGHAGPCSHSFAATPSVRLQGAQSTPRPASSGVTCVRPVTLGRSRSTCESCSDACSGPELMHDASALTPSWLPV